MKYLGLPLIPAGMSFGSRLARRSKYLWDVVGSRWYSQILYNDIGHLYSSPNCCVLLVIIMLCIEVADVFDFQAFQAASCWKYETLFVQLEHSQHVFSPKIPFLP